eukprot:SAG31_NODE_8936_length_1361_cov_0.714739_3_plen_275_part_00
MGSVSQPSGGAGASSVIIPKERWFDSIFGLVEPTAQDGPTVRQGEYWVITAFQSSLTDFIWDDVCDLSQNDIQIPLQAGSQGFIVKTDTLGLDSDEVDLGTGNRGFKLHIQDSDIGTTRIVRTTGIQNFTGKLDFEDHSRFNVNIPNIINYPSKSRCLVQLQGVYFHEDNTEDENIVIKIPELNVTNQYVAGKQGTGVIGMYRQGFTINPCVNILQTGLLCSSPFGKRLSVSIMKGDLNNLQPLFTATDIDHYSRPFVVELRLLFLDNKDLKDL